MRTTLTLDDDLAARLKEKAFRSGKSFKQVVNEAIRAGLAARGRSRGRSRYRLRPASLGEVRSGIDLDHALRLAEALEDGSIAAKLELRK